MKTLKTRLASSEPHLLKYKLYIYSYYIDSEVDNAVFSYFFSSDPISFMVLMKKKNWCYRGTLLIDETSKL